MQKRIVDDNSKGKRFDVAATEMLPMLSRAYVHALIEGKRILLNGKQAKAGAKLRKGDRITIDFDPAEIDQIADIDLPILYEDDNVIVIDKPAGIISHSRGRYWNEPSVASFIRQKTQPDHSSPVSKTRSWNKDEKGFGAGRAGIVHRLDRATSGVMICAKNPETLSYLQKQFSSRKVKKTYTALVSGEVTPPKALIDMPIERNPKAPATFRIGANGKTAQTKYSVTQQRETTALLKLEPVTGRTHQLRVHMAKLNHPIIGDELYGGAKADRLMLHASSLEISIPVSGKKVFTSPLPLEFTESSTEI